MLTLKIILVILVAVIGIAFLKDMRQMSKRKHNGKEDGVESVNESN
jgi:hypothetical protein